ncbi:MAG: endonuclease III [Nanoarchaeota archaeon]|nr:endonuclease III [Nanoarchaeota archaeon]
MINSRKAVSQLAKIERLTNPKMRLAAEWEKPWQALISTILSPMTRDETTIMCSEILYKKYPSLKSLSKAKLKEVIKLIKPINYHKTKAKHIIETAKILIKNKRIPDNREELLKLQGVGRKVANVYLVHIHNTAAIGVDTHVAYLSKVLGWTKNQVPRKIERDLEKLFPKRLWNSINYILVRFGRMHKTRKKQVQVLRENKII